MDRFERGAAPACLSVAQTELCVGQFNANTAWNIFRGRVCYGVVRSALMNTSSQTCAFCAGGFAQSPESIEHFQPKAGAHGNPNTVLEWANLFPACMRCQQAKGDGYSPALLKPDADEYSPAQFFIANADDGSLEAVPGDESKRAEVTINTYQLNRAALKRERRRVIKTLGEAANQPAEEYRYLAELFPIE